MSPGLFAVSRLCRGINIARSRAPSAPPARFGGNLVWVRGRHAMTPGPETSAAADEWVCEEPSEKRAGRQALRVERHLSRIKLNSIWEDIFEEAIRGFSTAQPPHTGPGCRPPQQGLRPSPLARPDSPHHLKEGI